MRSKRKSRAAIYKLGKGAYSFMIGLKGAHTHGTKECIRPP